MTAVLYNNKNNDKTELFFIIATNFNETSIASTHIESDYFP